MSTLAFWSGLECASVKWAMMSASVSSLHSDTTPALVGQRVPEVECLALRHAAMIWPRVSAEPDKASRKLASMSIPFSTKQFEKKPNRSMPAVRVRLDKIVPTQRYYDSAKVNDIAAKGADDGTDPIVHQFQGKYHVSDGHHRVAGAIARGDTTIRVRKSK